MEDVAVVLSPDEERQVRQLGDRRYMETQEELRRISAMRRVEALKHKLDRKLGRNLYTKLNAGPLQDLKRKRRPSLPRSGLEGCEGDSDSTRMVRSASASFRVAQLKKHSEEMQELAAIENMGIVRSSTDGDSKVKSHVAHCVMYNQRLMIKKPHGRRGSEHKKSSVLVTNTVVDPDEQARQLYRQQSKAVIEGFMQAPSHKQRVLDKLSSNQKKKISDSVRKQRPFKYKNMGKRNGKVSQSEFSPIPASPTEAPPTPTVTPTEAPPTPTVTPAAAPPSSSTADLPTPIWYVPDSSSNSLDSDLPAAPPTPTTAPPTIPTPTLILCIPETVSLEVIERDSPKRNRKYETMQQEYTGGGEDITGVVRITSDGGGVVSDGGRVSSDGGGVAGDSEDSDEETELVKDRTVSGANEVTFRSLSRRVSEEGEERALSYKEVDVEASLLSYTLVGHGAREKPTSLFSNSKRHMAVFDDPELLDVHAVTMDMVTMDTVTVDVVTVDTVAVDMVTVDEVAVTMATTSQSSLLSPEYAQAPPSSSSSAYHRQGSSASECSPRSRHYTSPQLSLSLSSGDLEPHLQQSHHSLSHGFYSTVEVEVDPFAEAFRAGLEPSDDNITRSDASASCSALSLSNSSDKFSCSTAQRREIPERAYQDPRFQEYVTNLDHRPEVRDYITFKMAVIGDLIEKQYADKLNQAMDEVFYELKDQYVSWESFKMVSKRLLVQGSKVQDCIMLVPCFARQLMDLVPQQLSATISQYTTNVLDTYASDNILSLGGWSSLMESYGEDLDFSDESVLWQDADVSNANDNAENSPTSPAMTAGSAATLPVRKGKKASLRGSQLPSPAHAPPPLPVLPRPFPLRRCISVEVLLEDPGTGGPETTPFIPSPSLRTMCYSRATSLDSLDLATPSPATPGLSFTISRTTKVTQVTDSALTPGGLRGNLPTLHGNLPTLHEESRLSSRRSSTCSVIILPEHTPGPAAGGFGVVLGAESMVRMISCASTSSSVDYVDDDLCSNSGDDSATPPSSLELGGGRRRSSVAELIPPLTMLTVHLVAVGCLYLNR